MTRRSIQTRAGARRLPGGAARTRARAPRVRARLHPRPDRCRRRRGAAQGRARSPRRRPAEPGRAPDQAGASPGAGADRLRDRRASGRGRLWPRGCRPGVAQPRPRHSPSGAAGVRAARGARFRHAALEAAHGLDRRWNRPLPQRDRGSRLLLLLESLQNVVKHAGTKARAQIRLAKLADELCFEIDDDGVGYAVASTRGAGTGVSNMAERVAALRGTLTIDSANGRGTRVRGRIPLHADEEAAAPSPLAIDFAPIARERRVIAPERGQPFTRARPSRQVHPDTAADG